MSDAFKETPERDGYFAYLGAEVPRLPPNPTREEFEKLADVAYSNLEKAINTSRIPIEISGTENAINIGYVTMGVKKQNIFFSFLQDIHLSICHLRIFFPIQHKD